MIKREGTVQHSRVQRKQIVQVINSDEEDLALVDTRKRQRKPKAPVAPTKSLAFENLPSWIKPHFDSKLMPTILEIYGAEDDPWDLDHDDQDYFRSVVQETIDLICPRQHHSVTKGERIYAIARQGVYSWRTSIQRTAIKTVKQAVAQRGTPASSAVVKKFATGAIAKGGEAFWGNPHPSNYSAALMSPYILKTFSVHMQATLGSLLEDEVFPCGALSLSVAAVQRAFEMHLTGKFQPGNDFSEGNAGALTQSWRNGSVEKLMSKPHRFDALIVEAIGFIPAKVKTKARGSSQHAEAADVFDPSSPIASASDND
ncbi:hypothetical protein B0H21DRAFT_717801, partial [Amylocystis lapponica]